MDSNTLRDLRWKEASYIPQGSMHVLNPVRRIQDTFHDFIAAHNNLSKSESVQMTRLLAGNSACPKRCSRPIRTSFQAACASA
ncbi:MAG: hypothetical protein R2856_32260 [Caldilineaceae bacterium]